MTSAPRVIGALVRRALNEIVRVPGAAIPGVLAPTIFIIGLSGAFGAASGIPGFDASDYRSYILPVGLLQGAGFTGAATGVNLARDIEQGWFDRLLLAPVSRPVLLAGVVASACLRALLPGIFLVSIGLIVGVNWPGVLGLVVAVPLVMALAAVATCWATTVALHFRSQQAAPLMQIGTFSAILFTTAYAPKAALGGWLRTIADVNPVTHVLEGIRQGFVGSVTWADTWPAYVASAGLLAVFGAMALRGISRADH